LPIWSNAVTLIFFKCDTDGGANYACAEANGSKPSLAVLQKKWKLERLAE
jgi:hypothetical protein